jgi:predicted nucleic acid-binding protein
MIVVADISFILALFNRNDSWHIDCTNAFRHQRKVYVPQSTLAEVAYMLARSWGNERVAYFLENLPRVPKYEVVALTAGDMRRAAQLLRKYSDSRIDFVDASIAAVAERLEITRILTPDHRDLA